MKPTTEAARPENARQSAALWLVLALLTAALAGCNRESTTPPETSALPDIGALEGKAIARVNGRAIPESLLLAYLRTRGQLDADQAQRDAARRELINLILLGEEAHRLGLLDRESIRATLAVQRLSLIARHAIQAFAQSNPITPEDIENEYRSTLATTGRQEYRLRHILVDAEADAKSLLARIEAGEPYLDVEAQQAGKRDASVAGEIGWVNLSQVPASFGPVVAGLEPGQVSAEPVSSEYGYHIVYLEDQRDLDPPPLDEVRDGIRNTLGRERIEAYLSRLRSDAEIEIAGSDSQ